VYYIPKHTRELKKKKIIIVNKKKIIKAEVHKAEAWDIKKEATNPTVQNRKERRGWKGAYL
jgi:hypothetical protein